MLTIIMAVLAAFLLLGGLVSGGLVLVIGLVKLLWPFVLVGVIIKIFKHMKTSKSKED